MTTELIIFIVIVIASFFLGAYLDLKGKIKTEIRKQENLINNFQVNIKNIKNAKSKTPPFAAKRC